MLLSLSIGPSFGIESLIFFFYLAFHAWTLAVHSPGPSFAIRHDLFFEGFSSGFSHLIALPYTSHLDTDGWKDEMDFILVQYSFHSRALFAVGQISKNFVETRDGLGFLTLGGNLLDVLFANFAKWRLYHDEVS